jgi:hypothetical protein
VPIRIEVGADVEITAVPHPNHVPMFFEYDPKNIGRVARVMQVEYNHNPPSVLLDYGIGGGWVERMWWPINCVKERMNDDTTAEILEMEARDDAMESGEGVDIYGKQT